MNLELIEQAFPVAIRKRGLDYQSNGQVTILEQTSEYAVASVAGTGLYEVTVRFEDDDLCGAECECPYAEKGLPCKHMWATLLELAANSRTEGSEPNQLKSEPTEPWKISLSTVTGVPMSPQNQNTEEIAPTQFSYVIDLDGNAENEELALIVLTSHRLKSGKFSVLKPFDLVNWKIRRVTDDVHRDILMTLESFVSHRYYSAANKTNRVSLRRLSQPVLFEIAKTGRLYWKHCQTPISKTNCQLLQADHNPPWHVHVNFLEDSENQQWVISGELRRDEQNDTQGPERLALNELLLSHSNGLALTKNRLLQIEQAGGYPWLEALQQSAEIVIPSVDRKRFTEHVQSHPTLADVGLPDRLMKISNSAPVCQPLLQFVAINKLPARLKAMPFLFGLLSYQYEQATVTKDDPRQLIPLNEDLSEWGKRNTDAERQQWNLLKEYGAEPLMQNDDGLNANVKVPFYSFGEIVRKLAEQSWKVEAENAQFRLPGDFQMSVSSGIDWFDLKTEIQFDEVMIGLPELLAALKRGENYVELSDGSRGLLPEDWLARYARLAEVGEVSGDTIRFRPSQAMLLDALLQEQEHTTVDRKFSSFRNRLKQFDGIKPSSPGKTFQGELRDYQKEGLGWIKFLQEYRLGGCLADDMGLGKTIQVLALLDSRRTRRVKKDEQRKPSLVVVPKSLVFNWMDEAARFTPRLKVLNYTGLERIETWNAEFQDCHVILTTYGTMRIEITEFKDIAFDYVILDEAQAIKNETSLTAKASRLLQADHRLAMTGTPVENHLGELWSLFEFLNPKMLGNSATFKRLLSGVQEEEQRAHSLSVLSTGLKPFLLRRTKQQVLTELPDKTEQTLFCEMAPRQRKLYDDLRAHYRTHLSNKLKELGLKKSKLHVLEALLRLRQAACHPALIDARHSKHPSAKLDAAMEQIVQLVADGHKALVFSQFTSLLSLMKERLDTEQLCYEYLDGKTSKRQEHVKRFQNDPDCPLFLISLKAGGHGLNLTAADYVFILDPWWNPAVEAQAVDRAHRMGQQKHVFAYRLICKDTVEERILEMQKSKKQLADAIISEDKGLLKNLTADDLQLLLS